MSVRAAHVARKRVRSRAPFRRGRALAISIALLLSSFSQARQGERMRHFTEPDRFLGWSKDGRYAVWHEDPFELRQGCGSEYPYCCNVESALVVDTRRGTREHYLLDKSLNRFVRRYASDHDWEGFPQFPFECVSFRGQTTDLDSNRAAFLEALPENVRAPYRRMPSPSALRALLGKPLVWNGPAGEFRFAAELKSKRPIEQKFQLGRFSISAVNRGSEDNPHVFGAIATFSIKRDQQTTATIVVPLPDHDLNERAAGIFEADWAPDQRHVVLIYSSVENIKRGPFEVSTALMPTVGSKIALETSAGQLAGARNVIGDILYNAGRSLLKSESVSPKQLAAQTQVLAIEGYEPDAQAIAALLPGGATVGRQTERTSYHVTIKLGRSTNLAAPAPTPAK